MSAKVKFNDEIENKIVELYLKEKNKSSVARKMDIPRHQIDSVLKQKGVKNFPLYLSYRRFDLKDDFLKDLNSFEQFYFLGWIASDGCIRGDRAIMLGVSIEDIEIIRYFTNLIQPDRKININKRKKPRIFKKDNYNCNDIAKIDFRSKEIYQDIVKFGITPNKSLSLDFPRFAFEEKQLLWFLRGYFDGDGGICITNNKNNKVRSRNKIYIYDRVMFSIVIAGARQFLTKISEILIEKLDISPRIRQDKTSGKIFRLEFGGNKQVEKFLNWLYFDDNFILSRKKERWLRIRDINKNKSSHKRVGIELISEE